MNANFLQSIIGGAVDLSSSLLSFGGQIYAVNHAQAPVADVNNYTIQLPDSPKQESGLSAEVIILVVVVVVLLIIGAIIVKRTA